jgi:hypothetical protein
MAGQYRFKDQSGNVVAQISASADGQISFSGSAIDFSNANTISLGEVQLAGTASNAMLLDGYDYTAFTFTSSIHPFTSSTSARLNSIETVSASNLARLSALETTSASVDTLNTSQNNRLNSLEQLTGSLATTGSNLFIGSQTITGSLYISADLIVQGTSSIQNITGSAINIGTNLINLNTATPAVRYAGISVQDSGSNVGVTGSMLWDSLCNRWIYSNPSTIGYSGGMLLSGPRTQTLGSETTLTCGYIPKSGGGDHLYDSCVYEMSGSVGINCSTPSYNLDVNGCSRINGSLTTNNINILNGNQLRIYNTGNGDYGNITFATATGFTSDKKIQANAKLFIQRESNGADTLLQFKNESGVDRGYIKFGGTNEELAFYAGAGTTQNFIINASGCVGINTSCPKDLLEVYGGTNNGITICASGQPRLGFFVGGASADNKIWDFIPQDNNTFIARTVNDAKNSAASWLSVTRSGTSITSICFPQANPIFIAGCVGINVVPNGPGLRLASDSVLRVEGASSGEATPDNFGISLGGRGSFRIDAPGIGAGRFNVTNAGTVGIGVTSPGYMLDINDCTAGSAGGRGMRLTVCSNSAGPQFRLEYQCTGDARNWLIGTNQEVAGDFIIRGSTAAGANPGGVNSTTRFSILKEGYVGIGIVSPTAQLHICSAYSQTPLLVQGGGNGNVPIACFMSGVNQIAIIDDNGNLIIGASSFATRITPSTNGLAVSGKVGIGTTGNVGKLTIQDTGCVITSGNVTFATQAKGIDVVNSCSGNTDNVIGYWISTGPHKVGIASGRTNAASTWEVDLRFYTHPTSVSNLDNTYENMRLYGGGNLTINGTLAQTGGLSDINQKENLVKISNALNKIKCINGYNFDWKDGSPYNGDMLKIVSDAGLIAQEVEEVMPDIVRETKWDCHKTLNYNGVIALLVEGMKEQQCIINTLKTCIGIN